MSASIRRYVADRENFDYSRGFTEKELEATKLRQEFLKKFIINFDTNLYKTSEQRDWSQIAKREYRYDVQLTGIGQSIMLSNAVLSWRIFTAKKMVFWPLALIPVSYYFISSSLLQKHTKKLFDMCNLGEEYYLGQKRNEILKVCNNILDVEDF